jgi:hypothetical protein
MNLLDIGSARKQLAMVVGVVWVEVDMCVEVVSSVVDKIEQKGVSPKMADTRCTRFISPVHANNWWW